MSSEFDGWQTMSESEALAGAAALAAEYNWPTEAAQLRGGVVPEGFAREVGSTIALFLAPPVISIGPRQREQEERDNNRAHARRLVRLRVLLAKARLLQRARVGD